ncbi:MAG TPA: hypothetical protein VGN72_12000 [Tepidisphaeraceae bacterium]|jgi:hypothetical protein|nr:hypothetical protein [Tepidisphaeraceae bacterium]
MPLRLYQLLIVLAAVTLSGCLAVPAGPSENVYVNRTEAVVRAELGEPSDEFASHYGNPPLDFRRQFTGEIKTLVFKKPGGEHYISFEKRPDGWIAINSSWLPAGAVF